MRVGGVEVKCLSYLAISWLPGGSAFKSLKISISPQFLRIPPRMDPEMFPVIVMSDDFEYATLDTGHSRSLHRASRLQTRETWAVDSGQLSPEHQSASPRTLLLASFQQKNFTDPRQKER